MAKPKRVRKAAIVTAFTVMIVFTGRGLLQAQINLSIKDVQVLNTDQNRICQYVFEDGQYKLAWQSAPLEGYSSVRLGDVDNDGAKEIVASVLYQNRTETIKAGKRQTTQTWGSFRIEIFEDGTVYGGGPSWFYDIPGEVLNSLPNDSYLGDVDNDGDNDLVLIRSTELDAFHFPGENTVPLLDHICTYPSFLFSLEVGDADNLGDNELIVVPGSSSSLGIWKHLNYGWEQKTAAPVPSSLWGPGMNYCGVTYVRVRNADNIPGNEIIATGNNQRLMVWKYEAESETDPAMSYKLKSWSPELAATMAYGIDSGDLDGDNSDEVVISVWGGRKYAPRLVVLAYAQNAWSVENTYVTNYIDQRDLRTGELDGMPGPEIVLNNAGAPAGLKVLKFLGGTYQEVYAALGYGYGKIEIR